MTPTPGERRAGLAATLVLLAALILLSAAAPASQRQGSSYALQALLGLAAGGLCLRAAAGAAGLARAFWATLGLASLLWAGGVATMPADPHVWLERFGRWNFFFGASTGVFVVACGLRPDRPRGGLGVLFDVAILAMLAIHTWFYFGIAFVRGADAIPPDWAGPLKAARFALLLACAVWLVQGSRAPWRRTYLRVAAAIVLLFGGHLVLHGALAAGLYRPGLWDLPLTLPFLLLGFAALEGKLPAAEEGAFTPEWSDLRRGTRVALLAIAFVPALEFTMTILGAPSALDLGPEAHVQISRARAALGLATTALLAVLLLWRQLHLLRWAERVQASREGALRQSEQRFFKAFSASPAAMSISSLEEGRYIDVNRSYLRMMGLERDEVIGRTSLELGFFERAEQRARLIAEFRESGSVAAAPLTLRRRTGELRDLLISLEPIDLGPARCLLGVVEDVTERRRAEQALMLSERRYRMLFERNLAGFFRTTTEGRILECNDSFVRILGYDGRDELMARSAVDLYFSVAEREREMRALDEAGALTTYEARLKRKDGAPVWIVENEMLVPDEQGRGFVIEGTVIDITERKRAEDETRRLAELKTNFLVVAAHEMRTPLTVLSGYHELLLAEADGALTAEQRRSIEVCRRTVERLNRTFNDILAALQLAEGRVRLRREPLDLAELARQVVEELTPFLARRGQKAGVEVEKRLAPIGADAERLHEALSNLVENAIKFTPDGGEITVRLAAEPGWQRLTVEDTGIGIEPRELTSIWERFYAGADPSHHSSGTYEFKSRGPGLGLSIAKGYVEAHGGTISAASAGSGRGATFTIRLPAV